MNAQLSNLQTLLREDLSRYIARPTPSESTVMDSICENAAFVAYLRALPLSAETSRQWNALANTLTRGLVLLGTDRIRGSQAEKIAAVAVQTADQAALILSQPAGRA